MAPLALYDSMPGASVVMLRFPAFDQRAAFDDHVGMLSSGLSTQPPRLLIVLFLTLRLMTERKPLQGIQRLPNRLGHT
jgi:hypothetical protein